METLFNNIKIITPFEVLYNHSVIIEKGKIKDIIEDEVINLKDFKTVIDGEGMFLAPGFIDIHNHGNSGYDVMDATEEALDKMGEYHISKGVTSYLGTALTSSYENLTNAMKNIV